MTKLEAIIRPETLGALQDELGEIGVRDITVVEVSGTNHHPARRAQYRGVPYQDRLSPRVKVEVVVADRQVERAVNTIRQACCTGEGGDGKIFLAHIDDAIRIRNGQRREEALF